MATIVIRHSHVSRVLLMAGLTMASADLRCFIVITRYWTHYSVVVCRYTSSKVIEGTSPLVQNVIMLILLSEVSLVLPQDLNLPLEVFVFTLEHFD